MLLLSVPLGAWADREVNQPQFGKQVITVASDEVITFYDFKGSGDISSSSSNNSHSLTVFQPAETGKSVQISFEEIDIYPDGTNFPAYMTVYSGTPDDSGIEWATTTSGVTTSTKLPDGDVLKTMGGNDKTRYTSTNETFVSGAADGSMAVGFIYKYASACKGWKATVKVVTLENMTVTGAGSSYEGVGGTLTSKQNAALANAYVTAEGVMNPDHVTGIGFTMTKNESAMDAMALKLFKGDKQVEATVSADGQGYLFTLDDALSDGTTTYTVKGDFLGTAAVGAQVQVDITKILSTGQPDGISPFTAATAVEVENPALVIMTSTPQTVTVGETPLQFYDEGGKDGGIVSKTNGQVTFLSGVEGKKVMVDFTTNKIWHGSYYNQELRIYSGQAVSADNLLKTLQQGETALVRSTAEDGSLTVVLFSDASNDVAADGFEATVSLFTPQPMDFNGITTAAASTETVAAGDEEQPMLYVTVTTQNTEPAMEVTKMAFTAGDNFALVSKAQLFLNNQKVGETDVNAAAFTIELDEKQTLQEGDHTFTLSYTISDEALNDQKVSAQVVSVSALVNNAEKTESATCEAVERTVKNIVLSHANQGTVTKTVNNSIAFETKAKSEYSSYCEAGTDDRVNIFVPKHEGMVCQIDFSEFDVQYSSTSYGTKSVFKIYAGQGTNGTLLWELNDNSQEKTGPGQIVRSTAADGSLTIVFNPKSSYSYYYNGWKATVSEYLSKDMLVAAVEATQTTTADASIGAAAQELLSVNVKTEGNLNALTMDGMKLNLKGTEGNLSTVAIWQGETLLGSADAAAEVTVSFGEAVTLAEGDNLFTVKADVKADAEEDQNIDAKVVSVHVGSADVEATAGDPEGARTLKNMVLMTSGNHGVVQLDLGKTFMIYDDGGAEGDGADGVNATLLLAPTGDADCVRLTDKGISFNYQAHLRIYKGNSTSEDNLIGDLSGSLAKFDPIVSDADVDGGQLTIVYEGKGSYTKPNFAIQAEGYKKQVLSIATVTIEDISVPEVLKGQTDVKMLQVCVDVKGDTESVDITAFKVESTDNTALDAYHIYSTGTYATFSANEAFADSYTIEKEGKYYFWITADVKTDAEVGQEADLFVSSLTANGETVNVDDPTIAIITVASGKSGDYTVGQGGDYATIQQAIDDMGTLGMDGPVTLKIKAGEYNEKVRIPYIKGMGSVNTLTIESESGERDVKVYHNNYTTSGYSEDQHTKDYGVITLYEASYVTLRNLEVYTTDKAYKAVVMVKDKSRHATIENCYLHAPICTTTGEDVCLVGHTIIDEENGNNDYLTVKNCLLEGGKMGVSMGGTSYVRLPKEVGGVIEGNTFKNNGTKAIYLMDELGAKVRNNVINIDADVETKISVGVLDMQLRDEYSEATEITGNIFNVAPKTYCAVMNLRQLEGTADAPVIIANNVVNLASLSSSYAAFKFNGANVKNVNVANNTFRMTGAKGGPAFWASSKFAEGYGTGINVVNNIIQNETDGYAVNLYNDDNLGKINFQNNLMYAAGSTFFRAASETTGDFATFVEKTGATGCINKQVEFASNDILMPATTLDGDLLKAVPLSYVTTDVTGKERPTENISIGAYEYSNENVVPMMAEGYPTAEATHEEAQVKVKADADGMAFLLVKKADEAAPTADEVAASPLKAQITADTEATLKAEGLDAETEYVAYVVLQSTLGTSGEVVSVGFTTQPEPIELMAVCTEPVTTVASGEQTELKVMVASGKAPFTVTWKDSKHETVGSAIETELLGEEISLSIVPDRSGDYYVTVIDAQHFEANDTCRIIVTGDALVADFENLYLEENSFWRGPDTKGTIEEGLYGDNQYQGSFVSGSYKFANNYSIDWGSWSGFSYANSTATTFSSYTTDQWNSCVGKGCDDSDTYAVFFEDSYAPMTVSVLNNPAGDVINGFFITNAAVTVNSILNGDGQTGEKDANGESVSGSTGFRTSDYIKLTITADNGKTKEVMLADYRDSNEAEHYYLDSWQWVDLKELGTVKELSFSLEPSRSNTWGYTTPLYFCMDNLNGTRPETEHLMTLQSEESAISLANLFEPTTKAGTVNYAFADELTADLPAMSISDGVLTISSEEAELDFTVVLKATQNGASQYVRLRVVRGSNLPTAISGVDNNDNVDARYAVDGKTLTNGSSQKGVQIVRQKDGTVRKVLR